MGLDPIAEVALEMGFGRPTGIPLDGESPGIAPSSAWYKKHLPEGYTLGAAVNVSVGQGASTATPIQLAKVYTALANGGTVFTPQIGLRIEPTDGTPAVEIPPKVERQLKYDTHVMDLVREGLRRVVNDPGGTAYSKRLPNIEVSGKTGTAQVAKLKGRNIKIETIPWHLRDHAWFASYAPANDPEIVVVVLNEHGGGGSKVAAPAAMQVIAAWYAKRQARAALDDRNPLQIAVLADEQVDASEEEPWTGD
jgi:penicillin-binding protein 2